MDANMLKFVFFGLILLAVVLEVAGDVLFKKWALENRSTLFIAGLAIYFIGTIFWAISLKYEFLSRAITVFTVLNLVLVTLAGVLIFNEELTLANKAGIVLGVLSIILVEL